MQRAKLIFIVIVLLIMSFSGHLLLQSSLSNQKLKSDYAELNHFRYGLFSVNQWKQKISGIVAAEIENISFAGQNQQFVRKELENQLRVLIDKVYQQIEKTKTPIELTVMDQFVDVKDIKKGVPEYAKAILKEMSKPKSEQKIKGLIRDKVDRYLAANYDFQDDIPKTMVLKKYQAKSTSEGNAKILALIKDNNSKINLSAMLIVFLAILLFILEGRTKGMLKPVHYFSLTFALLILMIIGVATPMIDMEAKISKLSFMLFDHPVIFENQILYFQSKSILDVFHLMITHKEIPMKFVGILVVTFSVLFPLGKMLASLAYYYDYCEARKKKIVTFFVHKSGKWSMADVLVVAIFMAYIGFNGIINSQLKSMGESSEGIDLVTTNGTALQPGFYVFMTYAILAMFLSGYINNRPCPIRPKEKNRE